MEITDSACVPTFSFPFVQDCHQCYELMIAQGEGRSPMTSSDAETDSKPIIINIIMKEHAFGMRKSVTVTLSLPRELSAVHKETG